jgi:hypothetical protein
LRQVGGYGTGSLLWAVVLWVNSGRAIDELLAVPNGTNVILFMYCRSLARVDSYVTGSVCKHHTLLQPHS